MSVLCCSSSFYKKKFLIYYAICICRIVCACALRSIIAQLIISNRKLTAEGAHPPSPTCSASDKKHLVAELVQKLKQEKIGKVESDHAK